MNKLIDFGPLMVVLITFALFLAALFTNRISHEIFLEAGVFLSIS